MCKTRANARGRLKEFVGFFINFDYFREKANIWMIFMNIFGETEVLRIFAKKKIFRRKLLFARKRNFAELSPGIKDGCAGQDPLHSDPVLFLLVGAVQRLTDGA
jgi:hypothetical protein